ncbi:methionine synthase [Hazenella coriacea]|uniref:Methionine synthase n=1 Tax=Hazenella coriacea TaxID=1179467 RepID=A0A4R3L9C1_9BACL|nr:methionine synthase [Hazenella coriacea]TCS95818.1 methionine synthase (B12-dependent) [Hazenella coriacea]
MTTTSIVSRLQEKIVILDGAMGTMLQQADLVAEDFGGEPYEGCNEILNLTRPELIQEIHEQYFSVGADVVETNTFGATPVVLAEYGLQDQTEAINLAAVRHALVAKEKWSTTECPRYVAGSMGPTTKTLSVTGGVTFEDLVASYYRQAKALIEGGVDVLLLETAQDTLNVKAASIGIQQAFARLGQKIPIMISGTIEPMGTMLAGQNIEAFYLSIQHLQPIAIGLNCATGPEFMKDHLRSLAQLSQCAVSCYPNAGLPDENGHYLETPQALAKKMGEFADEGWINLAGGCCGTTPAHIRALVEIMEKKKPRGLTGPHLPAIAGMEPLFFEEENRPILVGERTNAIGSRKFKRLIIEGKVEEAAEIARKQVKGGAQVIDICLANPERDELEDMEQFIQLVTKKVKVPLMIDSMDAQVMERALTYVQGKAVINSINFEDGERRFSEAVPLLQRFGAAVVVGTIDEKGMAVTRERKLEVAQRSYQLLVERYGLSGKDIIFDPLVFPVGTGDANYIGSALETVESIRLLKESLPECSTILGISNVSFGLPPAGREVLNAVFLYECTKAGLDLAIVNTEKLERYASISESERRLARALLFQTTSQNYEQVLAEFTDFYRDQRVKKQESAPLLSLEERLSNYIIEGSKDGLVEDLAKALEKYTPLEIINGPLMSGMDEVGRLFNENQLIVAEVLQSAEAMKASVSFLEPYMDQEDVQTKGKVILATVKGDVHDIGKNLVDIILSNNGYEVINLGIKVPPEQLIDAIRKEKPDLIGLSGLLVKSAQQMVVTAQDLQAADIQVPMLVGGAALTRKFTETRIAPKYTGPIFYAKDAMNGLELSNRWMNPKEREQLLVEQKRSRSSTPSLAHNKSEVNKKSILQSSVNRQVQRFHPPHFEPHVYRDVPISHLIPYINEQMLLGRHLGIRGNVEKLLASGDQKAMELKEKVDFLLQRLDQEQILHPKAVFQFFPAQAEGDTILIYDPQHQQSVLERFYFPRQSQPPYLCLADYLRPRKSGEMDVVGFLSVTAGHGVQEVAERWKQEGNYLDSHMIQAIALELAEAFAERLHQVMRDVWGFPDPIGMTMKERFAAKYQGMRVSFGYPACPHLEDQEKLFRLIHPERIGVHLTEGYMMEPEASVTAMVFAHPEARYFRVDEEGQ